MPRQAGIYLRISEDRQNDGLAVERQREDCRRLAEQRGWTLVEEFVDNDISASGRRRRPGFDALIEAITTDKIDTVVAVSMDRITRNKRDELRISDACAPPRKVLFALVKGSDIDTSTAAGVLVMDLLGAVARNEIAVKSERHRRQIQQSAEAGRPNGGPRAFGYKKGGLEIDRKEAPLVAELYARYLAGAGTGELADWLNRLGVPTPKGKRWRNSGVRVVLTNPRNAGIRGMRPIVNEATGARSQYHEEIAKAVWPAIVSEETFRAAVAKVKTSNLPGRHVAYGPTQRFLLTGIALCGREHVDGSICGLHMISSVGAPGVRTYECTTKRHVSRKAQHLDAYIETAVLRRLQRDDAHGLLQAAPPGVDLAALQKEALVKRERRKNLTEDYADGLIGRDEMRAGVARLKAQLDVIESRIAAAGEVDVLAPLVLAQDFDAAWDVWARYPMTSRRTVLKRVVKIVVKRGRVGRPPAAGAFDPSTVDLTFL